MRVLFEECAFSCRTASQPPRQHANPYIYRDVNPERPGTTQMVGHGTSTALHDRVIGIANEPGERAVGRLESEVRDWLATGIEASRLNQRSAN
jgi:hypothetical protein